MVKADLHNHLGRNGDNPGFDETIDIAYSRLGEGGIFGVANCDDYRYEGFVEQRGGKYQRENKKCAVYVPEKDILVVKCQEMFTDKGDVLAIAMPHNVNVKIKDITGAIKQAEDCGAALGAVHPFYVDGIGKFLEENPEFFSYFSTFEVYNASAIWIPGISPRQANHKAIIFYLMKNLYDNLGISASTDGHSAKSIGKSYTMLDDYLVSNPDIPTALKTSLRDQKSIRNLHMQPNRADALKHHLNMGFDKIKRKLKR